jgi:hypothetical protein
MTQTDSPDSTELLSQILKEMREIKLELKELKQEKEKHLWEKSIEHSLSKIWDNEQDEEWNKLMQD